MRILNPLLPYCFLGVLFANASTALDHDWSLEKACKTKGGTFKKRENPYSYTGDTCDLKFKVATHEDDAEFCELYAPWRLLKVTRSKEGTTHFTTCHVEATLMCKEGWWQMFGWCMKMPDKLNRMTRPEAEEFCAKETKGGEIAYIHHRYIPGVWKRYFRGVGQIWVSASESFDQYVQKTHNDGSALALAFTGNNSPFYTTYPYALVRVDPSIRHQILCQYKPPMSNAEIAYLGRRYSEIYYPSIPVHDGILIRSASSYTSSTPNVDVCEKTLKPFMVQSVGSFIPDEEAIAEMGNVKLPFVMTRSGAEALLHIIRMNETGCQYVNDQFIVKVPGLMKGDHQMKDFKAKIACDNMKSAAVMHSPGNAELRVMSDSRSMPIWCKLGQTRKYTYNVSEGYELFERMNGSAVSHRLYMGRLNYTEAESKCKADGAHLSGVNSLKEANALGALAAKAGQRDAQFWLGGKRKEECYNVTGYVEERGKPCSRENVIQWQNGVATEFLDNWWRDGPKQSHHVAHEYKNPSSNNAAGLPQFCITYVSGKPSWADDDRNRFLDDIDCAHKPNGIFCTKEVEIVTEVIYGDGT